MMLLLTVTLCGHRHVLDELLMVLAVVHEFGGADRAS
jgi:hypothetical protein